MPRGSSPQTNRAVHTVTLLLITLLIGSGSDAAVELLVGYQDGAAEQVAAAVASQGCSVVQRIARANTLVVSCGQQAGGGPDGDVAAAAAAQQQLSGIPGVQQVARDSPIWAPRPPQVVEETGSTAAGTDAAGGCAIQPEPKNPDWLLGRDSEGTPYGILMAQAADDEVVALSRQFKGNVFYCVLDSGLDTSNIETVSGASGCMPGPRPEQAAAGGAAEARACWPFNSDEFGHGTPVAGVLAAPRNGRGVVGASAEGASVYLVKVLDEKGEGTSRREVEALADCLAELDYRKKSNPLMKMVVSMSYAGSDPVPSTMIMILEGSTRGDVLFVAAAGNENSTDTMFPAGYKEVISVGAVDWNMSAASFSNRNPDVELVAAGVAVLSPFPLKLSAGLRYYFYDFEAILTQPRLAAVEADPSLFRQPPARIPTGSGTQDVTAELVDCGLAETTCQNAQGKICLIERGGATATWPALFCLKTLSCMQGGGVGVVLYNNDADECVPFTATTLTDKRCPADVTWPTVIQVSRRQGLALRDALAALAAAAADPSADNSTSNSTSNSTDGGQMPAGLTVTLRLPPAQKELALNTVSGTSFATPLVSGVAGIVWAAHPNCTAQEIRRALRNTALKPQGMAGAHKDDFYGFGVVQALDAHRYLQQNLCEADKPKPLVQVAVFPSRPRQGGKVTLRVVVSDPRDGAANPGVGYRGVRLQVTPPGSMTCAALAVRTNKRGVATTECSLNSAGSATVSAQVVASKLWQAANSSTVQLTVAKR